MLSSPALRNERSKTSSLPLANIHLSLLAHGSGETATNTLDGGQGVDDLLLAIDVGVEHTKNVLELSLVHETLGMRLDDTSVITHRTISTGY